MFCPFTHLLEYSWWWASHWHQVCDVNPSLKSCQNSCNKARQSHQYESYTCLIFAFISHPWTLILCSHSTSHCYSQCCWQDKVSQGQTWSTAYSGHWRSVLHVEEHVFDRHSGHAKKLNLLAVLARGALILLPWLQATKRCSSKQIGHLGLAAKPCGKTSCQTEMCYSITSLEEKLIPLSARMKIPQKFLQ